MSLESGDIEIINRLIHKFADDVSISITRSAERLEERIDVMEARLTRRIGELEDRIESSRQDLTDTIGNVREEFRDVMRMKEEGELD